MKWERIFDLMELSRFTTVLPSATLVDGIPFAGGNSTGILRLGMRVYENTFSSPYNSLSCCKVVALSFNNTSRKFAAPECDFPSLDFLQHLSSECPRPEQKEHFTQQFSVL
jgi:hypothetical protein